LKTTTNASTALTRTADEVNSNLEIMNFTHDLRYDIAGSLNVYAFGSTAPASNLNLCHSTTDARWNKGANDSAAAGTTWDLTSKNSAVARTLFTVEENQVNYDASSSTTNSYIPPTIAWYGYEIQRLPLTTDPKAVFGLYRLVCPNVLNANGNQPGAPTSQKLLVTLGNNINPATTGGQSAPSDAPTLFCADSTTTDGTLPAACPVSASTLQYDYYNFTLPALENSTQYNDNAYHNAQKLMSQTSNPLLGVIKRKIVGISNEK